jgi:multiple sugar transport system permease protein
MNVRGQGDVEPRSNVRSVVVDFIDRHLGIIFLAPALVLVLGTLVYPIASNIYYSLTDKHLYLPGVSWVGFDNYVEIFTDPAFYKALGNTLIYTVAVVLVQLIFGTASALLLNANIRGKQFFRLLVIIPYAFPSVTVALLWKWILHGLFGGLNGMLLWMGVIEQPISWFSNATAAMPMAVLVSVWFGYPLFTLTILAGLQSIPKEHYEVARIEGASAWNTFWHVTFPSILRVVGVIVILRVVWVFNTFDLLFVLTGGGPAGATETLPLYVYRMGWSLGLIGQTAAVAIILFLMLFAVIAILLKYFDIEGNR